MSFSKYRLDGHFAEAKPVYPLVNHNAKDVREIHLRLIVSVIIMIAKDLIAGLFVWNCVCIALRLSTTYTSPFHSNTYQAVSFTTCSMTGQVKSMQSKYEDGAAVGELP